jgi:protein gp37
MRTAARYWDVSWNFLVGCTPISRGCANDWSDRLAHMRRNRLPHLYGGLTNSDGRWNGTVRFLPDRMDDPKHWREPRVVFVNIMSDTFHAGVSDEVLLAMFRVMLETPRHTYLLVTKRADRMRAVAERLDRNGMMNRLGNVWWIVSCEDQDCANKRIPDLVAAPVGNRGLSLAPLLGPIDLERWIYKRNVCQQCRQVFTDSPMECPDHGDQLISLWGEDQLEHWEQGERDPDKEDGPPIHWIAIEGEDGPRECNVQWIRGLLQQTRQADIATHVKQLGRHAFDSSVEVEVDRRTMRAITGNTIKVTGAGANVEQWPSDLVVRELPWTLRTP